MALGPIRRNILPLVLCFGLVHCQSDPPCEGDEVEQYVCNLDCNVDELVNRIRDARGVERSRQTKISVDGGTRTVKFDYPRMRFVGASAKVLYESYGKGNVPMTSYVYWTTIGLSKDDEARIRTALEAQRERLKVEAKWLEGDIRANPNEYPKPGLRVHFPIDLTPPPPYILDDDKGLSINLSETDYHFVELDTLLDFDVDALFDRLRAAHASQSERNQSN